MILRLLCNHGEIMHLTKVRPGLSTSATCCSRPINDSRLHLVHAFLPRHSITSSRTHCSLYIKSQPHFQLHSVNFYSQKGKACSWTFAFVCMTQLGYQDHCKSADRWLNQMHIHLSLVCLKSSTQWKRYSTPPPYSFAQPIQSNHPRL